VNFKFQKYSMFMLNVSLGFSMRIESGVFPYNRMQTHNSIRSVFLSVTSKCLVIQSSSTFLLTVFMELYLFSVFTCVSFLASIFDLCAPLFNNSEHKSDSDSYIWMFLLLSTQRPLAL
jgi:hypothetical protein